MKQSQMGHDEESRVRDLERKFAELFGGPPEIVVRAPGRVNLIGEHTDYNDGFVFPAAIDRDVLIAATPRTDAQVLELAAGLKREKPARTAAQVARVLRASCGWSPSVRTLQRHLISPSSPVPRHTKLRGSSLSCLCDMSKVWGVMRPAFEPMDSYLYVRVRTPAHTCPHPRCPAS